MVADFFYTFMVFGFFNKIRAFFAVSNGKSLDLAEDALFFYAIDILRVKFY